MQIYHQNLAKGGWSNLSFLAQMANTGSEVERALIWMKKANKEYTLIAFWRMRELLDLTIIDGKNKRRLKELTRLREVLNDYFFFKNEYGSSEKGWRSYFYPFMMAVNKDK